MPKPKTISSGDDIYVLLTLNQDGTVDDVLGVFSSEIETNKAMKKGIVYYVRIVKLDKNPHRVETSDDLHWK